MAERHLHSVPNTPDAPPPNGPERRRPRWREFRQAYPGVIVTMSLAIVVLLSIDGWLLAKRIRYQREVNRLRAGMSEVERRRTDAILSTNENRFRIALELIRRQSQGDKELHLTVSIDSGVMYLERDGALLRDMPVQVGPERRVGVPPDTVHIAAPRGSRTVERVLAEEDAWEVPAWVYGDRGIPQATGRSLKGALGPAAILLSGGTVIYSMPTVGPLNDSIYVLPGAIRARAADLKAIAPNLKPGVTVYFY